MQCFSFNTVTGLSRGVPVQEEIFNANGKETPSFYIGLGQSTNRHSKFVKLRMDKLQPPDIRNNVIYYAYPSVIKVKENEKRQAYQFVTLSKPRTLNRFCLVRICCRCPEKVIFGYQTQQYGEPRVAVEAWGCDDVTRPESRWKDEFVVIGDGDAVMVEVQSGDEHNEVRRHVLYNRRGTLSQTTMEQWERIEQHWEAEMIEHKERQNAHRQPVDIRQEVTADMSERVSIKEAIDTECLLEARWDDEDAKNGFEEVGLIDDVNELVAIIEEENGMIL